MAAARGWGGEGSEARSGSGLVMRLDWGGGVVRSSSVERWDLFIGKRDEGGELGGRVMGESEQTGGWL